MIQFVHSRRPDRLSYDTIEYPRPFEFILFENIAIPIVSSRIHHYCIYQYFIRAECFDYGPSEEIRRNNSIIMIFVKASSVWRLTLCVLAIAYVERHEMISVTVHVHAETSVSETLSIPGQIVNAKVPSFEPNKKQAGQPKQQLWLYEGALYDPLDGRKVAKVRGLELVQQLEDTSNLAIDSLLKHPNATYQDSKTLWSQKIFCYTTEKTRTTTAAGTVEDALREQPRSMQESILDSVRVRPRSPRKKVPLDQAVAVYETATTFISRKSGKGKRNTSMNREQDDDDDDETEVLVHSEWPNGQTMWGTARDCSQQTGDSVSGSRSSTNIDFTVFAKLRNKNSPLYSPDLILDDSANSSSGTRTTKSGDIIVSPKRASLVQFGSSDGTMETKHKFGARETYSYRNVPNEAVTSTKRNTRRKWFPFSWPLSRGKNEKGATSTSPSLYYTRYGEGPPFYAPGRMCMLELRGRPVSNLGEVGPLLRGLILGNSTSNNDQQSGSPAPISNFHWNRNNEEEEEASTEDMKGKAAKGVMVSSSSSSSSSNEPAIMSIQRAWNLRERQRDLQVGNSDRYVTTKQLQSRRRRMRQPLALKLTVVDDTSTVTGKQGIQKLTVFAKRGMNCAISIWERIQASTTMESRS